MRPNVKNRQRWDQLRTKTAHIKKREEEDEKSWCDKDRRETCIRVLLEKIERTHTHMLQNNDYYCCCCHYYLRITMKKKENIALVFSM